DYSLEKRLQSVFTSADIQEEKRGASRIKHSFPKSKRSISFGLFWLSLLCLLLAPLLIAVFAAISGAGALQLSVRAIEEGKITQAQQYASFGKEALDVSQLVGSSLFYLDPFVKQQKTAALAQIAIGQRLASTELDTLRAFGLFSAVTKGQSANPKKDFTEGI